MFRRYGAKNMELACEDSSMANDLSFSKDFLQS